jgi:hypothetical protein
MCALVKTKKIRHSDSFSKDKKIDEIKLKESQPQE